MAASLMPAVWSHFIFNLLLQVFDGLLTYHVLSDGIPEANPLVSSAIVQWGMVWGLLYWKTVACVLLALIFALRHRRRALTIKALAVTGAVYAYVSIAGISILFLKN
jgi:Domain of unknown function (DUF5658)